MQQINHENNLMGAAASTAKSNYKKLSRYRLFFAMAAACFVAPTAFLIYFIVNFSAVGIWAFAITSLLAAAAAAAVLIITVPRYKTASESIKQFLLGGGEKKKTPPLDVFCTAFVKLVFTVMAALLVCFVPTVITVCYNMTFLDAIMYMGQCLGAFWGMNTGASGFFAYIIGLGLMAAMFAVLLLIIKAIGKLVQ